MWARVLERTPQENIIFFSPTMPVSDYTVLPSRDGNLYLLKGNATRDNLMISPCGGGSHFRGSKPY